MDKYQQYEAFKRELEEKNLTPQEYEEACKKKAKELGI